MNLEFKYTLEKDVKNFIAVAKIKKIGKKSPSLKEDRFFVYKSYFERYGRFDKDKISNFIKNYIKENKIDVNQEIKKIKSKWLSISKTFLRRTEKIFKIHLSSKKISVYLTINNVCGYNINNNYFFVSLKSQNSNLTIIHELWHFYTWEAYGKQFKNKNLVSKKQYYDIKESLTEILNLEFKDLLEGAKDKGYPSHREIRKKIRESWLKEKNVQKVITGLTCTK